jgi:hypothetical protein
MNKSSLQKVFSISFILFTIFMMVIYIKGRSPELIDAQITPRYFLPLFLLLVGITLLSTNRGNPLLGPLQSLVITIFLTIGGALAWLVTISRFSIGPTAAFTNFWQTPEWWALSPTFSRLEFFALATITTFLWYVSTIYLWGRMQESHGPRFIKTLKE